MTPLSLNSGSRFLYPSTSAAALPARPYASMTSRTGALSILATSLVLANSDFPSIPSNSPMTPSMTAISAPSQPDAKREGILARGIIQESRLRDGLPVTAAWKLVSRKSGPILNPWTLLPFLANAPIIPIAMEVLPTPLWVPPITTRGIFKSDRLRRFDRMSHQILLRNGTGDRFCRTFLAYLQRPDGISRSRRDAPCP